MDRETFCRQSKVLVVAGKGGVGKTTVAAALARMAADVGLDVLVVALDSGGALPALLGAGSGLSYEEQTLYAAPEEGDRGRGSIRARVITPDDALLEYLADHGLQRVSKRLVSSGVVDVVATAIPGIRDVLVLGKVKQLERAGVADVVVLDAPATGHAMTFLTSASGLLDAARGGPVRQQASDVVELLRDPARCRVLPVTLPEEMPVSETIEATQVLRDRVGIHLGPVVVNCFESGPSELEVPAADAARETGIAVSAPALDALDAARAFRLRRLGLVEEQVARLARELPLPQLHLPRLFAPAIGPAELDRLAAALARAIEALPLPDAVR